MDFSEICRTCLSTELLSPIFKDNVDADSHSAALCLTTGIKIKKNDGLPQKICETCTSFLQDVENFQRLCQNAESRLLRMKETFHKEGKNFKDQIHTKAEKQKKDVTKNCPKIKCNSKMYGAANKQARKETKQPNLKNKSKITRIEAVYTDTQQLDEGDLICNNRNINQTNVYMNNDNYDTENINCDDSNSSTEYQMTCNNEKCSRNNDTSKTDLGLVSENNADLVKKTDLDIHESECETELLDISFDSNKDWFFKDVPESSNNFENIPTASKSKAKLESVTKTIKTDKSDTKIIENNTTVLSNTKMITTEIHLEKEIIQNASNPAVDKIDKKNFIEQFDVKNKKPHNSEDQLFEVNGNRVICKLCQKEMSKRSIVAHITLRHPGSDASRAKCDFCDSHILNTQMKRHTNKMHGVNCTICVYCHMEYSNSEELIDHVPKCTQKKRRRKTNTKGKESIVQCEICNKSMLKASLKTHQDVRHRGIKPVCEHCGRRTGNKLRLLEHLRARHGYAKLECSACEFRTASHTALTNHLRRHRGERPFVCEQCGAKFHAAYLLAQHKHAHRTHRDVKCEQCPAAFKTNNHLLMHKQACHDNNIYQCPQCPREFKCQRYRTKHMRALHKHTLTPP